MVGLPRVVVGALGGAGVDLEPFIEADVVGDVDALAADAQVAGLRPTLGVERAVLGCRPAVRHGGGAAVLEESGDIDHRGGRGGVGGGAELVAADEGEVLVVDAARQVVALVVAQALQVGHLGPRRASPVEEGTLRVGRVAGADVRLSTTAAREPVGGWVGEWVSARARHTAAKRTSLSAQTWSSGSGNAARGLGVSRQRNCCMPPHSWMERIPKIEKMKPRRTSTLARAGTCHARDASESHSKQPERRSDMRAIATARRHRRRHCPRVTRAEDSSVLIS